MPLLRYFVGVGGVLLALLFICDAMLPTVPLPSTLVSGSDLPEVRIRSDRKWPERVVFDTAASAVAAAAPITVAGATPAAAGSAAPADASAKAHIREAFAQLPKAEPASEPKMNPLAPAKSSELKVNTNAKAQAKRRVAKVRVNRPVMLVAQQPHVGFFDTW